MDAYLETIADALDVFIESNTDNHGSLRIGPPDKDTVWCMDLFRIDDKKSDVHVFSDWADGDSFYGISNRMPLIVCRFRAEEDNHELFLIITAAPIGVLIMGRLDYEESEDWHKNHSFNTPETYEDVEEIVEYYFGEIRTYVKKYLEKNESV